jgi:hypothetical protein
VSHDTYFKIKSDSKLLWAGGSRQVKLIDGVAVPLLEGGGDPACQHGLRWVTTV